MHAGLKRIPPIVIPLFLAACDPSPTVSDGEPALADLVEETRHTSTPTGTWFAAQYLPYGVPVPVDQPITLPPEPYDPDRHGPPLFDGDDLTNIVDSPDFIPPPKRRYPTGHVDNPPPPGTEDAGVLLMHNTYTYWGIYQANEVRLDLTLPSADNRPSKAIYVYAATVLPDWTYPGPCIESTMMYQRLAGSSATTPMKGWYDWCEPDPNVRWKLIEAMDSQFQNKYIRTYHGRDVLYMMMRYNGLNPNSARGYLYDFSAGKWVEKVHFMGTSYIQRDTGWSMWESWWLTDDGACPDVESIRAFDIKRLLAGTTTAWVLLEQAEADWDLFGGIFTAGCWDFLGGQWSFFVPSTIGPNNSSWEANTPHP